MRLRLPGIVGSTAESAGCKYLRRRGYTILTTNYSCRQGEVDIIAKKGDILAFVEVRSLERDPDRRPALTVTAAKRRRITKAARRYLGSGKPIEARCRYDILEVTLENGRPKEFNLIEAAFDENGRLL